MDTLNRKSGNSESGYESSEIDQGILRDLEEFDKRLDAATLDFSDNVKSMDESE